MGNIAPRWAKTASRCGNIGLTQSQKERERERQRRPRQRQPRQRQRRPRQRQRRQRPRRTAGHVQDGSPDFGVYQVYARAVSPLLEKDAPGTPEVPVPVLHREGLFGPPPTEDVDDVHLARTNSQTLLSALTDTAFCTHRASSAR